MKKTYHSLLSLIVAFSLAFVTTVTVYAAYQYVDDSSGQFTGSGLWTASCSANPNTGCYNGNAKYTWSGYNTSGRWNFGNKYTFEAWIPAPYANSEYGTVSYTATNGNTMWVTVNQTNWKKAWVYLGYISGYVPNGSGYVYMHAGCVSGYPCNNGPVLYDAVRGNE